MPSRHASELESFYFPTLLANKEALWLAPIPQLSIADLATNRPRQICCLAVDHDSAMG